MVLPARGHFRNLWGVGFFVLGTKIPTVYIGLYSELHHPTHSTIAHLLNVPQDFLMGRNFNPSQEPNCILHINTKYILHNFNIL